MTDDEDDYMGKRYCLKCYQFNCACTNEQKDSYIENWYNYTPPQGIRTPSYSTYKPFVPYEGVDRSKWPNTWWTLFTLFHSCKWYTFTKWVSEQEYTRYLNRKEPEAKLEPPSKVSYDADRYYE